MKPFLLIVVLAITQIPRGWAQDLTAEQAALFEESLNLQKNLASLVWSDWKMTAPPVLLKSDQFEFLINHPNPPEGYKKVFSKSLDQTVYVMPTVSNTLLEATFPINGTLTVVMSLPAFQDDPAHWILKINHEYFHLYQGSTRLIDPFVGNYESYHELSFPFQFESEPVLAAFRVEAEILYDLIHKKQIFLNQQQIARRLFEKIFLLQSVVMPDSLHMAYKRWMEWSEGVSRYSEYKMAFLAADSTLYQPTEEFARHFPKASYQHTVKRYKIMLYPVRFIGEGVKGRVMFYYSGMAKALLLDAIYPEWKNHYFDTHLDNLILFQPQ